jgi:HEAT repeat protein
MFKELSPLQLEEDPSYLKLKNALLKSHSHLLDRGYSPQGKPSNLPLALGRAERGKVTPSLEDVPRREAVIRQKAPEIEYTSSPVSLNSSSSSSLAAGSSPPRAALFSTSQAEERVKEGSQANHGSHREKGGVAEDAGAVHQDPEGMTAGSGSSSSPSHAHPNCLNEQVTREALLAQAVDPDTGRRLFINEVERGPIENRGRDLFADNVSGHFKHRVFISHRGTRKHDIAFPMMAIFSYFCGPGFAAFDRVTFEPGEENRTIISETLSQSVHCLVLITKDFFQSKWTVKEVDAFFKARDNNSHNQKKRKIIPLFMGLSPANCRSLKRSDCEIPGQSLSEEHFQRCQRVAERLSRFGGLQQHQVVQISGVSIRDFILNQIPDLLKKYLRDGDEPSLLPDFQNQISPVVLAYIYDKAISYYQRVNGEVNITNLLNLITKLRLQTSLRTQYEQYGYLERLFDERETLIVDSFINLALIKEKEHKEKERNLDHKVRLEEDKDEDKDKKEFIDERMASHEELYAVKEPLALNQLFEPKDDTKTPHKILILGRAGIGKTVLCQYLAVQWAFGSSECKDEEQGGELGNYLRQKFEAVFWVRLREVSAGSPHHNTVAKIINQFCLRGSNKPSLQELDFYIKSQSNKILFILDGYDEITDSIGQAYCPHLTDFLNEIINYQHVLVTSRPLAIDALGESKIKFDRKLENIGFVNENIEAYVHYFMRDVEKLNQADAMLKFLRTHPSIWGIAHIPINLELLSWLWSQGNLAVEKGDIKTLSHLYRKILTSIQEAYAKKSKKAQARPLDISWGSKEDDTLLVSDLVNEFLEYLAYSAMQQESLLIPKSQLKKALSYTLKKYQKPNSQLEQETLLKSATDKLGFLRSTREGGQSQLDQKHYFIHLSFQEFYAASYIARILSQPAGENQERIKVIHHIRTEKYITRYQLMLWMTAGLLYQKGVKKEDFAALKQFWKAILSEPIDRIGVHHLVLVMHCLDECEADEDLPLHKALINQQVCWLSYIGRNDYKYNFYEEIDHYGYNFYRENVYLRELARCPLLEGSKPIVDYFLKNLKNNRGNGIKALCRLSRPSQTVISVLLRALKEEYMRENLTRRPAHGSDSFFYSEEVVNPFLTPGETIIAVLLNVLKDKDSWMKIKAAELLGQLSISNETIIDSLIDILKDEDPWVRSKAVEALGRLSNHREAGMSALMNASKDTHSLVRINAVEALGRLANPNEPIIAFLLSALKDKDHNIRYKAVEGLGRFSNTTEAVLIAFVNALEDEDVNVKYKAIEVLSHKFLDPSESIIAALMNILKDKHPWVRSKAVKALGRLPNPSEATMLVLVNALKDKNYHVRSEVVEALGRLPNPSEAVTLALVNTALYEDHNNIEDHNIKAKALEALGRLPNPNKAVVFALMLALKDGDHHVKSKAVKALGRLPDPNEAVMLALVNALEDKSHYVRSEAVEALGRLPNPSEAVMLALANALKDKDRHVKDRAIEALGRLSNPSEAVMFTLMNALKDEDENVRYNAFKALGRLKNPSEAVIHVLLDVLEKKDQVVAIGNNDVLSILFHFKKNHIAIFFKRLINHQWFSVYLSRYFKENGLLCIDHENEQVIISLYNKIYRISLPRKILIHLEEQVRAVAERLQYPLDVIDYKEIRILQEQIKEPHLHSKFVNSDPLKCKRAAESQMQHAEEKKSKIRKQAEQEASLDNFEMIDLDTSTLPPGMGMDVSDEQQSFDADEKESCSANENELEKLQIELSELIEERKAIQPLRKGTRRQKWDNEHAELSAKIDDLEKQIDSFRRTRSNSHNSCAFSLGLFSSSSNSPSSRSTTGHSAENNGPFPNSLSFGSNSDASAE